MGIGVLFILQKIEESTCSPKKGEVGKIVEGGWLEGVSYVYASLWVYKSNKYYNPWYIQ